MNFKTYDDREEKSNNTAVRKRTYYQDMNCSMPILPAKQRIVSFPKI